METRAETGERKAAASMPGGLRRGLIAALAVAFAGALFLIATRGEALLVDLATFAAFCF